MGMIKFYYQHHVNCEKIYSNKNIEKLIEHQDYKYICPFCLNRKKSNKERKTKFSQLKTRSSEEDIKDKGKSLLGNKVKNNYSNENFEFSDYKPRFIKKKKESEKQLYNGSINFSIMIIILDDNRDIYHDLYKIMNDNEDTISKKMTKNYSN